MTGLFVEAGMAAGNLVGVAVNLGFYQRLRREQRNRLGMWQEMADMAVEMNRLTRELRSHRVDAGLAAP